MLADLALVVAAVLAAAGSPAARPRACLASDLTARAAFLLAPRAAAFVHIRWSNWCGARSAPVHLRLWIMTVQPRVQVRGTVPAPRCDSAAAGSTVAVGPFESL